MSDRRRVDRQADLASRKLERAARIIPDARTALVEQRRNINPIRAASTDTGRSIGSHGDPTGSIVAALAAVDRLEGYIDDALASIHVGIRLLEQACANALGSRARPAADEPTCYVASCGEIVSSYTRDDGTVGYRLGGEYGGMCDTHRARTRREKNGDA